MESKRKLIERIKGGLIVSCQAKETDPHYWDDYTIHMAKAAIWGGAIALRLGTPNDIRKIKKISTIPIIGLWKVFNEK